MTLRDRIARPVVALYWLAIIGGLALYTALEPSATTTPLWIGVIAGTCLGQVLALLNLRLWLVAASVLSLIYLGVPMAFMGVHDTQFWMALVPSVLCGFWSLGDRSALVAFWFPTVLWMLSILDRTRAHGTELLPDGVGAVLLGALAVLFVMFLRARESRRVALWRSVGPTPIAPATRSPTVLRERAGAPVSRLGWTIATGAIACGITAWIAPHLWKLEELASDKRIERAQLANAKPTARAWRDHGELAWNDEALPCCPNTERHERERVREYFDLGRGRDEDRAPRPITGIDCRICTDSEPAEYPTHVATAYGRGGYVGGRPTLAPAPAPEPSYGTGSTGYTGGTGTYVATGAIVPQLPQLPQPSAPLGGYSAPPVITPTMPPVTPSAPSAPTSVAHVPSPSVAVSTPRPSTHAPRPIHETPPPPPPTPSHHRAIWIALLFVGALMFQIVALALRPIRRAFALRHLRRPYWEETVDQRISNSWHLALVGLRDAGWRASSTEAPREFAQRTGITGIDRCATILERARHGIGIDRGDLDDMARSADDAYRSAREQLGGVARTAAWLRWPLT